MSPSLRRAAALPRRTFLISVKVLVATQGVLNVFLLVGKLSLGPGRVATEERGA